MMSWQITLWILLTVNVLSLALNKVAADKISKKSIGIFYQYLFCGGIASLYFLFLGKPILNLTIILIGMVGFINAFGNYCQWRAFELSLSKTVLFLPLMEAVSIILAVIFLRESFLWNFQLILGAVLCFLAMWLLQSPKKEENTAKEIPSGKWFLFILGMIIISGITGFLVKLFSFQIPRETFFMGWYVGAFLGSLPLLGVEKQNPIRISKNMIFLLFCLSIATIGALFALYWTYQLGGPVSFILPIRGLSITIIPIILGWFIFKERKKLSKQDFLGFLCGTIGVILILLR